MNRREIIISLQLIFSISIHAQEPGDYYGHSELVFEDFVYKSSVKTVLLDREGLRFAAPIIQSGTNEQLVLRFDELNSEPADYSYTFIYCDMDWTPSRIPESQTMRGFPDDRITHYSLSFNTRQQYVHYELRFPNENLVPLLSGNYLLKVFESYHPEKVILTRRFMIAEDLAAVDAEVKRATVIADRYAKQEINFTLDCSRLELQNPFNDIRVVILQNGRWDSRLSDMKPLFVRDKILDYNFEDNVFNGGNEFRTFDTRSYRVQNRFIKKFMEDSSGIYAFLNPDQSRSSMRYSIEDDINGRFLITTYDSRNEHLDADYVHVNFKLLMDEPMPNATPYVFGALTDWRILEEAKMKYDFNAQAYYCPLLLKQGYYNYQYVVLSDGENQINDTMLEGNHFETENDYIILVYYRLASGRYDRLAGWRKINSKNIY